jgi:predicted RNA-binding protein with PIN domain
VFDDSAAAAEHLVASPGAVLVVDGYNVSHAAWPGTSIADQRERLVTALAELHARAGVEVEVVFDGADVEPAWSAGARTPVRVRFSPAGVEADDVVLQLVDELPRHRPVVVASSDRRVRDGARARGAATVSSTPLLSVLHR